jgi:hypothetical protein
MCSLIKRTHCKPSSKKLNTLTLPSMFILKCLKYAQKKLSEILQIIFYIIMILGKEMTLQLQNAI